MNTEMTWRMHSTDSANTERFGESIGNNLRGGEVIELVSDLGGGKTTLTRGLARGAGSTDAVASPTFTISREYKAAGFTIVHFDFYRLAEAGLVADELAEYAGDAAYVVVVEWGDIVQDVLPHERLRVDIRMTSEDERELVCTYPASLDYLLAGAKQA